MPISIFLLYLSIYSIHFLECIKVCLIFNQHNLLYLTCMNVLKACNLLSMIETACRITGGEGNMHCVKEIVRLGQELLQRPVTLLDGVEEVLLRLQGKYRLVLATKGDLFDQRRKVRESGLMHYFCHIEIMSDKKEADYWKLLTTVECAPQNFLMLGNSVKSDILPVLELGGYAAHIPYHVTWQYETHDGDIAHPNFIRLKNITDIMEYLL